MPARSYWKCAPRKVSGALLLVAGAAILMGIITAEALHPPGYSTARNDISDLGTAAQPTAAIFNATMLLTGALIVLAAYCLARAYPRRGVAIALALLGVGVLGVGIFPGYPGSVPHLLFSLLAFTTGGVAALLAARVTDAPFRYLSAVLGIIALLSLALSLSHVLTAWFGGGGAERWVAYPTVLWLVAFGGYLLGAGAPAERRAHMPGAEAGQRQPDAADEREPGGVA